MEGDKLTGGTNGTVSDFNPLPPRGGRLTTAFCAWKLLHFNPLPPRGGRPMLAVTFNFSRYFNPLPPRGGRLPSRFCKICSSDFNPLPPRGGRPFSAEVKSLGLTISIHSLRVEGDNARGRERPWRVHISIHSLRVEGDRQRIQRRNRFINFNPLPPRGGRPQGTIDDYQIIGISIHSLRVEGDVVMLISDVLPKLFQSTPSAWRETRQASLPCCPILFQSTPSAWRETQCRRLCGHRQRISIHSLRVEGDD